MGMSLGSKGAVNYAVLLGHRLRSEKEWAAAQDFSQKYWNEKITAAAQKNEPWDWKISRIDSNPYGMKIQYNILAAAQRQMFFNYQVKLPHYKDPKFLTTAAARYVSGFLQIQKTNPDEFWVPTYDIDLMWHAHMLHPEAYSGDTTKITGKPLKHDDSINDRMDGGQLANGWERTQKAWTDLAMAGEPHISKPGGMWRGNPTHNE